MKFKVKNTYSRKKQCTTSAKSVKNININLIQITFNITNNSSTPGWTESSKSESSGDLFDKLIKGRKYNVNNPSPLSSAESSKKFFSQRQDTATFYNSDAELSISTDISNHLFKDSKDYDGYSPDWPSPVEYCKLKNKLQPVIRRQNQGILSLKKNYGCIQKVRHVTKPQKPKKGLAKVKSSSCTSSTPNRAIASPSKDVWLVTHVSPIMPVTYSPRCSSEHIMNENGQDQDSAKQKSVLGVTALIEGLGNLGIETPQRKKVVECNGPLKEAVEHGKVQGFANEIHEEEQLFDYSSPLPESKNVQSEESSEGDSEKLSEKDKENRKISCSDINNTESSAIGLNIITINGKKSNEPKKEVDVNDLLRLNSSLEKIRMAESQPFLGVDVSNVILASKPKKTSKSLINDRKSNEPKKEDDVNDLLRLNSSVDVSNVILANKPKKSLQSLKQSYYFCKENKKTAQYSGDNVNKTIAQCSSDKVNQTTAQSSSDKLNLTLPEAKQQVETSTRITLEAGKKWRRSLLRQKHTESKFQRRMTLSTNTLAKLIKESSGLINNPKMSCNMTRINDSLLESRNIREKMSNGSPVFNITLSRIQTRRRMKYSFNNMMDIPEDLSDHYSDKCHKLGLSREESVIKHGKGSSSVFEFTSDTSVNQTDRFAVSQIPEEGLDHLSSNCGELETLQEKFVLEQRERRSVVKKSLRPSIDMFETPPNLKMNPEALNAITDRKRRPPVFKCIGDSNVNLTDRFDMNEIREEGSDHSSSNFSEPEHCREESVLEQRERRSVVNRSARPSIDMFETPPNLKMNPEALNAITDRKRTRGHYIGDYSTHSEYAEQAEISDGDISSLLSEDAEKNETSNEDNNLFTSCFSKLDLQDDLDNSNDQDIEMMGKVGFLLRCGQQEPIQFTEAFPDKVLRSGQKIGEGVYGEVFMLKRPQEGISVVKIIPVEGNQMVNGAEQKHYDEVLSELIITEELSMLRENTWNCTSGFCELKKKYYLIGRYPYKLLHLWQQFAEKKGSDNECPSMFEADQLYLGLELAHAGEPVETFPFKSPQQALAVFLQTTFAIAVAEGAIEFEHRDLHIGNVLVKTTCDKYASFVLNGSRFQCPTFGAVSTIIDYTLSRITFKGDVLYLDLEKDPELFTADGDYQFDIYRHMRADLNKNWQYHQPKTNIRWLHYLVDKLTNKIKYKQKKNSKLYKEFMARLINLKSIILDFYSAADLAEHLISSYCETHCLIKHLT